MHCIAIKILIAGQAYKVMNAIFYHSICIEKSHYMSMCREETSVLGLKLMIRKLQKSNGLRVLKISMYYFYKKLLLNIYNK